MPIGIDAGTPNSVSRWDETAAATINQPNASSGTPEETQSIYAVDLATVHAAIYDAVVAIAGGHQPFYVTPRSPGAGASQDAAASAAAYGVLKGLFPSRGVHYQPTYDRLLAGIPDGSAKALGIALGAEVAAGVLAARASSARTADQAVSARFHTEAPSTLWPRNLRLFTMTSRSLADQARLGALIWVVHADATIACFESKYTALAWRPFSAINFADTDGNDATAADPAWKPFLPTPPHPEYPAAHGCVGAAMAEALRAFYGTPQVGFDFDSRASATTHHYDSTDALVADITIARIAGGMHFRSAMVDGIAQGRRVAAWVVSNRFQPK